MINLALHTKKETDKKRTISKKKQIQKKKNVLLVAIIVSVLLCACLFLIASQKIHLNSLWVHRYPVSGIDVSHYQGTIDWEKIKEQGIDFAFVKATEGSGHVDTQFQENWEKAREAGLYVGAYHFFSFDSAAASQAELYIQTVGELSGSMIPIIDIEYYADKKINPPDKAQVMTSLQEFVSILEETYGQKPMIYTTYSFYHQYLKDTMKHPWNEYPLWIRNVYYPPMDIGRKWQFWQYSDQGTLDGMDGTEKYVDLNVFYGEEKQLQQFLIP